MAQLFKITYVCNAGILAEYEGKKFLIDGLCNSNIPIFKYPSKETVDHIIKGIPPFDHIDVLLFSHHHTDHFDLTLVAETLKNNSNITMVSTPDAISMITPLISEYNKANVIALTPALHTSENIYVNGIRICAFSLIHEGKEYKNVQNFAYLVQIEDKKILHVGDAKSFEENFININLIQEEIDLLLVPFYYIGRPSSRRLIRQYIAPKKIGVLHLPYENKDKNGWIKATKKSWERVKDDFVETTFLEKMGTSIYI